MKAISPSTSMVKKLPTLMVSPPKDKEGHTFKVGSTTEDFGGDFKDGSIDQVLFWKRSLSKKEISTAAKKENR